MIAYAERASDRMPHLAFVAEDFDPKLPVPVRIHSECMTGDVFGFHAGVLSFEESRALRTFQTMCAEGSQRHCQKSGNG